MNGLFSETPDASPHPLDSVTWGRCTLLCPGEKAAGGGDFYPSVQTPLTAASLPTPTSCWGTSGPRGRGHAGTCWGRLALVFTEFARLPNNPGGSLWSSLILAEAIAAQRQRGQGTCPRSHSEQDWNPSLCVVPVPLTCLSSGHPCHESLGRTLTMRWAFNPVPIHSKHSVSS